MPSFTVNGVEHEFSVVRSGNTLPDFVDVDNINKEHIPFSDDDVLDYGGNSPGQVSCVIMVDVEDAETWKSLGGEDGTLTWFLGFTYSVHLQILAAEFYIDEEAYLISVNWIKI